MGYDCKVSRVVDRSPVHAMLLTIATPPPLARTPVRLYVRLAGLPHINIITTFASITIIIVIIILVIIIIIIIIIIIGTPCCS